MIYMGNPLEDTVPLWSLSLRPWRAGQPQERSSLLESEAQGADG